uniref:G-protein coupled receptors family 3 profile domain-containing protein n=1 Tax=Ornithorhynchus anatinus TaxID=9258 RepID=F6R6S4_ORNAN
MVQSFIFAVEEVNRRADVLPNLTLGFSIRDSGDSEFQALRATMGFLTGRGQPAPNYRCGTGPPVAAVIGEDRSALTIPMATWLGLYKFPQVSYGATVAVLSDKTRFPSFLRTLPPDSFRARGLARLVSHLGWTWVGLLAQDDDYGQQGSRALGTALAAAGVCVEFLLEIPSSRAEERLRHLGRALAGAGGPGKVWVGSDVWDPALLAPGGPLARTLGGALVFSSHRGQIPGFREFLGQLHPDRRPEDPFVITFWEEMFACRWSNRTEGPRGGLGEAPWCTGEESLKGRDHPFLDMGDLSVTYSCYNAVHSVARALHALASCEDGAGPFGGGTCARIRDFQPWQLLHYLWKVRFRNSHGEEVFFDALGDPPALYDIMNWQETPGGTFHFQEVGKFDSTTLPGQEMVLNDSSILWLGMEKQVPRSVCSESCPPGTRQTPHKGKPPCCFDCTPCPEGQMADKTDSLECRMCPGDDFWPNKRKDQCVKKAVEFLEFGEPLGAALASLGATLALATSAILALFIRHRETPIVRANGRALSYVLLTSLLLCDLCSLLFLGRPGALTCLLRQVAFGLTFTLGVSCVLAKTIMVVIAFRATVPGSPLRRWLGPGLPGAVVLACSLAQGVICATWLAAAPSFPERDTRSSPGKVLLVCNEGSPVAFWCVLGYLWLLALVSFVLAFLARRLPDGFNEAKFITFSMVVFVSVWGAFLPAHLSTRGRATVAVEVFSILCSSSGLLGCIFFPKCYILLVRPDRNTREFLMGRETAGPR